MPNMNLHLISPRSSKTISSGQVPQIALQSLWPHGQCWPPGAHTKKYWPTWEKSRFGKKFESKRQNRNACKIQIDLGIWILNQRFESNLLNRKQDKIQMPNMNLHLISRRSSKTISSGQAHPDCAAITLVTWAMLTTGRPYNKYRPIWEKSRFGKKFESDHQNRNVYKIQIDLGIWILNHRFGSCLQNRVQDKTQMPDMGLNSISQRGTRLIVIARPPRLRYHYTGHHGQCWPPGARKKILADLREVTIWQEIWILPPEQERI